MTHSDSLRLLFFTEAYPSTLSLAGYLQTFHSRESLINFIHDALFQT